jgi:hypothetical protein
MPELQPYPPIHEEHPAPPEVDPLDVLRNMAHDMAEAMNLENPDERHAALRWFFLDEGAAEHMGRHGDVFLRGNACEAAGYLIDDENRAAVAQHLFCGGRLVDDVQVTLRQLRHTPDRGAEFLVPLVAQVSFGATLLPPDGPLDAALRDLLPPQPTCADIADCGIAPLIAGTADAVSRMNDPALKVPRLRALLSPEAIRTVALSGLLETIEQVGRVAAQLPPDEMRAVWRDLLSLNVCETLGAQGRADQVMWAEYALQQSLPEGDAKEARLNALRPPDLTSDPPSWRNHVTPGDGGGSDAGSVHWSAMLGGSGTGGSRSTSSATPPDTPRGRNPVLRSGAGPSTP